MCLRLRSEKSSLPEPPARTETCGSRTETTRDSLALALTDGSSAAAVKRGSNLVTNRIRA